MVSGYGPFIRGLNAGWTYFVQPVDGGPIKIGYTRQSPKARLRAIQIGSPVLLEVVGMVIGDREVELHQRFAYARMHGEWFRPVPELVGFILECESDSLVAV